MRRVFSGVLLVASLAASAALAAPFLSARVYETQAGQAIEQVDEQRHARAPNQSTASPVDSPELKDPLLAAMEEYNQALTAHQALDSVSSYEQPGIDLTAYGLEVDSPVGYLTIPAMQMQLPIYLGATKENLDKGAAVLGQTSMPVGGEGTNSVISAHRGWRRAAMLRDVELLRPGDRVLVDNLWETLTYEVVGIQVIEPDDLSAVLIQPGRDLITLMTCHPYLSGTHRYLVYCERVVEDEQAAEGAAPSEEPVEPSQEWEPAIDLVGGGCQETIFLERRLQVLALVCCALAAVFSAVSLFLPKKEH